MKIRIFYTIDSGVYTAAIHTENWSEDELTLMAENGDPEVSVSGTIILFPAITGSSTSVTMGSSVLEDSSKEWRTNSLKGRTVRNLTKAQSGIVVNNTATALAAVIGTAPMTWDHNDNYEITQVTMELVPSEKDLYRIRADSPLMMSFDIRDYPASDPMTGVFTTAENMADGWAYTMLYRIEDARTALLSCRRSFVREEVFDYE